MLYHSVFLILTCTCLMHVHAQNIQCSKDGSVNCEETLNPASMYSRVREYALPRLDPGKAGHKTVLHLVPPKKQHIRITRSINPPIFEIPNFLSWAECDHVINVARAEGLDNAMMFGENDPNDKVVNRLQTRKSEVTFLGTGNDEILQEIRRRGSILSEMPMDLVDDSEELQVGHYNVGGHYHSHYDSSESPESLPCCHQTPFPHTLKNCIFCRYVTILMYLNDVEKGGETAFPLADTSNVNITDEHFDLTRYCHRAPVVVKPRRGTAIMWYSNHRDSENGWLGSLDYNSLHGGCPVRKGEKWIATLWISAAPYDQRYDDSIF